MAFNKAKEERKWLNWKESEEKQMREFGVSEDVIERLERVIGQPLKQNAAIMKK